MGLFQRRAQPNRSFAPPPGWVTEFAWSVGLLFLMSSSASADSAIGTWVRPANGAHITVFDCEGGLGMKVATAPEPENVGKVIMCGAKPTAGDKWKGDVLNLDNGKTYSGYVTLNGDSLELSGCVLGGLICKTETWSRLK